MEALNVQHLTHYYTTGLRHKKIILKDISFTVKQGELVSFIGINGAGKTTLLKSLVGITNPAEGTVTIFNSPLAQPITRSRLGFMPESPSFYDTLTAHQFLLAMGGLFGLSKKELLPRVKRLLTEVGLSQATQQPIRTFSKGMRQRLGFAQALIADPQIIFLDEPLDGLDPLGRLELKKSIVERQKKGLTIVLCSHILSDIAQISSRIGIIHRGSLLTLQETNSFTRGKDLEQAFVAYINHHI